MTYTFVVSLPMPSGRGVFPPKSITHLDRFQLCFGVLRGMTYHGPFLKRYIKENLSYAASEHIYYQEFRVNFLLPSMTDERGRIIRIQRDETFYLILFLQAKAAWVMTIGWTSSNKS